MKAVLFEGFVEDHSLSMQRYAHELSTALRDECGDRWDLQHLVGRRPRIVSRVVPGNHAVRFDSAIGRYIGYPFQAHSMTGDVFHILDHGYAQLALGLDPSRTVVTCHDLIPLAAHAGVIPMPVSSRLVRTVKFRASCMSRAAWVIADSTSTRDDVLRFTNTPAERIRVIHPGVSPVFAPLDNLQAAYAIRRELHIPVDARIVLHVGTRGRYKNIPTLLRAFHELRRVTQSDVWLLRVGAGPAVDEERLIDELALRSHVIHVPISCDERLVNLYRGADVLAFPSIWEGFGWPPLESMACGTPVVTSNVGSLPEVVGDAAVMVEPRDHQQLARALNQVLTDRQFRDGLVIKGLARARQFTWTRAARETLAVYETVVHG